MKIQTIEQYEKGWSSEDREDTIESLAINVLNVECCRYCKHNSSRGCSKWNVSVLDNEYCKLFFKFKPVNPAGPEATYNCSYCGVELLGEDVGVVAAGETYANGAFAKCPRCRKENSINRDDEDK